MNIEGPENLHGSPENRKQNRTSLTSSWSPRAPRFLPITMCSLPVCKPFGKQCGSTSTKTWCGRFRSTVLTIFFRCSSSLEAHGNSIGWSLKSVGTRLLREFVTQRTSCLKFSSGYTTLYPFAIVSQSSTQFAPIFEKGKTCRLKMQVSCWKKLNQHRSLIIPLLRTPRFQGWRCDITWLAIVYITPKTGPLKRQCLGFCWYHYFSNHTEICKRRKGIRSISQYFHKMVAPNVSIDTSNKRCSTPCLKINQTKFGWSPWIWHGNRFQGDIVTPKRQVPKNISGMIVWWCFPHHFQVSLRYFRRLKGWGFA